MVTKVSIIDVDLGINIDELIARDVIALTEQAQKDLDTAIAVAKQTKDLKVKLDHVAQQKQNVIKTIYEQMLQAGADGLSATTLDKLIDGTIANRSAFSTRFKSYLTQQGNQYRLEKKRRAGIDHYSLVPFNQ